MTRAFHFRICCFYPIDTGTLEPDEFYSIIGAFDQRAGLAIPSVARCGRSQVHQLCGCSRLNPAEISEALLPTCTGAESPPYPLLRSFGGLAGGLLSFKSSLHCKDQAPRSWLRPLS